MHAARFVHETDVRRRTDPVDLHPTFIERLLEAEGAFVKLRRRRHVRVIQERYLRVDGGERLLFGRRRDGDRGGVGKLDGEDLQSRV